jgi:hypothetical protein
MTPDIMGKILIDVARSHASRNNETRNMDLILSAEDAEKMRSLLMNSLAMELRANPEITLSHDMTGGMQINFKGDDVFLDFSDEALTSLICAYVGPKLASIIR